MKYIFIIGAFWVAGSQACYAQSIPTMVEQIAALQALERTMHSGYQLVTRGLQDIGSIRNGEYQLHAGYFGSLTTVKPQLTDDPKVKALLTLQVTLKQALGKALDYWRRQRSLQP